MLLGQPDDLGAGRAADVGGVHDGEPAAREPLADDVAEHVEGVLAGGLVVLVVGDQAAAEVRRHDLEAAEVARRERRLAGARDANERHEAEFGDVQFGHGVSVRVKIAAWVGVPSRGSASPTPRSSTLYPFSDAVRPAHAPNVARSHSKRWSGCRRWPSARS